MGNKHNKNNNGRNFNFNHNFNMINTKEDDAVTNFVAEDSNVDDVNEEEIDNGAEEEKVDNGVEEEKTDDGVEDASESTEVEASEDSAPNDETPVTEETAVQNQEEISSSYNLVVSFNDKAKYYYNKGKCTLSTDMYYDEENKEYVKGMLLDDGDNKVFICKDMCQQFGAIDTAVNTLGTNIHSLLVEDDINMSSGVAVITDSKLFDNIIDIKRLVSNLSIDGYNLQEVFELEILVKIKGMSAFTVKWSAESRTFSITNLCEVL